MSEHSAENDAGCTCGTDATSLNLTEVVVHRGDGQPCYIAPIEDGVGELADAFMAAWDPRSGGVASEHTVQAMRSALAQAGWTRVLPPGEVTL